MKNGMIELNEFYEISFIQNGLPSLGVVELQMFYNQTELGSLPSQFLTI